MADIASCSLYATTVWCTTYIILLDQRYTRSEKSIASPTTIRRHLHHMDHLLDLRCHPLQYVCNPFRVEGGGELIGKVVVEMVGEVMVKMVRAIVVHLSQHCLCRYPLILTHHSRFLYPHKLTHHLPFPQHLHIFTISGVTRASLYTSRYHLIIPPFIIPYIASHR